jgi:hypothetical protein
LAECDGNVQSELCVPIIDLRNGLPPSADDVAASIASPLSAASSFIASRASSADEESAFSPAPSTASSSSSSSSSQVVVRGIIDAESFQPGFFTPPVIARIARLCYELGFVY